MHMLTVASREVGDDIQIYLMSCLSQELNNADHYLAVAKVREGPSLCKGASQIIDIKGLSLKMIYDAEVRVLGEIT
jgi:hypothetical protein